MAAKIQGTIQASVKLLVSDVQDNAQLAAQIDASFPALAIPSSADALFDKKATLAPSATVDHDLSGALVNPFGDPAVFVRVFAIALTAADANVNDVVLGGAATNAFLGPFADATDKVKVPPGGAVLFQAKAPTGWVVTPATADLLRVGNGGAGTSVDYRLIVLGASA